MGTFKITVLQVAVHLATTTVVATQSGPTRSNTRPKKCPLLDGQLGTLDLGTIQQSFGLPLHLLNDFLQLLIQLQVLDQLHIGQFLIAPAPAL